MMFWQYLLRGKVLLEVCSDWQSIMNNKISFEGTTVNKERYEVLAHLQEAIYLKRPKTGATKD
jgi:hypothetical protein